MDKTEFNLKIIFYKYDVLSDEYPCARVCYFF